MILYIDLIITIFFACLAIFSSSYKLPLLAYIMVSPVVAASWKYRYSDMSLIYVFNIVFILGFLIRLSLRKEKLIEFPYFKLFIFYVNVLIFTSIMICMNSNIVLALDFLFKSLIGPLAFYLFYIYFIEHKDIKNLVKLSILAGFFPLFFTLFQKSTGYVWKFAQTRGIVRNIGLYHDAVTPRIFLMQMLISIYIYWHYFLKKDNKKCKYTLVFWCCLSIVGLYFLYSKTIFVTFLLWFFMFVLMRRKFLVLALALALIFFVNFLTHNQIYKDVYKVFSREIYFVGGELESDYVLSGRGSIWKMYFNEWSSLPLIRKAIGDRASHGYYHNDYIRILLSGGILLFGSYLLLVINLLIKVFHNFQKYKRFIDFAALLCIVYSFVESIGQVSGVYPPLQIITWGIVALSLNLKIKWRENVSNNILNA